MRFSSPNASIVFRAAGIMAKNAAMTQKIMSATEINAFLYVRTNVSNRAILITRDEMILSFEHVHLP